MKSLSIKVAFGVAVGSLCGALLWVPQIRDMEQEFGLRWLFKLRGPLEPPKNVVLVTMSRHAASNIFLPRDPEKYHRCIDLRVGTGTDQHESLPPIPARWPRCLHALLIDKLNRSGARTIVFDVLFRQRAPQVGLHGDIYAEQDATLARAMGAAHNVVIAQRFDAGSGESKSADDQPLILSPSIEIAALGVGPFQLSPSASRRVDRYDAFKEEGWVTPGLPIVALQAYSMDAYPAFRNLVAGESSDAAEFLPASAEELKRGRLQATSLLLRQIFQRDPSLAGRLNPAAAKPGTAAADQPHSARVNSLVSAYSGEASRLFNFIGSAGRIPAIGYDQALGLPDPMPERDRNTFMGKAVFVGYAEATQAEHVEHFSAVYSRADGIDLSGVEIAATALLNLLDDTAIRTAPIWLSALIAFIAGLTATVLCLLLNLRISIPVAVALAAGYLSLAVHLFSTVYLWMPLVVPLFIGTPAGIACATASKYVEARRQRDRVRVAFRHFVPSEVADELERNAGRIVATRKSLNCVCVATDAGRFTTLAESMASEALTDLLNEYFDSLFKPVVEHDGFVSDVVGDAMLAIWPDRETKTRRIVCTALLEMREAADEFNRRSAGNRLATRFGANWGKVTLATVGARAL